MSKWAERLFNHPIDSALDNMGQKITLIGDQEKDFLNVDNEAYYYRIKKFYHKCDTEIRSYDPDLINFSVLDPLVQNLNYINSHLEAFIGSKNFSYLDQANTYVDAALGILPTLYPWNLNEDGDYKKSITAVRQSSTRSISFLKKYAEETRQAFQELQTSVKNTKEEANRQNTRIDNLINNVTEQVNSGERRREESFTNNEKTRNEQLNNAINTFTEKSSEILDNRKEAINNYFKETIKVEANNYLDEINDYKEKAATLVNIITTTSMASAYQTYANDEKTSSRMWSWWVRGSFITLAMLIFYVYYDSHSNALTTTIIIFRLSVASALVGLIWYSISQSSYHRNMERKYRNLELELTAITPYLSVLPDPKKEELVEKFADKYFGKIDNNDPNEIDSKTITAATDLLIKQVAATINKTDK